MAGLTPLEGSCDVGVGVERVEPGRLRLVGLTDLRRDQAERDVDLRDGRGLQPFLHLSSSARSFFFASPKLACATSPRDDLVDRRDGRGVFLVTGPRVPWRREQADGEERSRARSR